MIIECPGCGKRISDKYHSCPHCGVDIRGSGEGISQEAVARRRAIQRNYRIQAQMYIAILLTVAGCLWVWHASDGLNQYPGPVPIAALVTGAAWYIGVRLYTIFARWRR